MTFDLIQRPCTACNRDFASMSIWDDRCSFCVSTWRYAGQAQPSFSGARQQRLDQMWQVLSEHMPLDQKMPIDMKRAKARLGYSISSCYLAIKDLISQGILEKFGEGRWSYYRLLALPDGE